MKYNIMKTFLLSILCSATAISFYQDNPEPGDAHWIDDLKFCLSITRLNFSIFGVSQIEDLTESGYKKLANVDPDKRGCLVACVFKQQNIITAENFLEKYPPMPDPTTKLKNYSSIDNAFDYCRSIKDICDLGNCLFEIYFNYDVQSY